MAGNIREALDRAGKSRQNFYRCDTPRFEIECDDFDTIRAHIEALEAERDALRWHSDLLRRVVMFAEGRRAPSWMPRRFLDECRESVAAIDQAMQGGG